MRVTFKNKENSDSLRWRILFATLAIFLCLNSAWMPTTFRWFATTFFLLWGASPIFMMLTEMPISETAVVDDDAIKMPFQQKASILKNGPVGMWFTSAGSADILGADEVRFLENGSGLIAVHSTFSSLRKYSFLWKMGEHASIHLQVQPVDADEAEGGVVSDSWSEVQMEFRMQENGCGKVEVLAEVGNDGFWLLSYPLRKAIY